MAEHQYGLVIHENPGEGVGPRYYAGFRAGPSRKSRGPLSTTTPPDPKES